MTLALALSLYAAAVVLIGAVAWRVWAWARTPEPFHIPTTTGQQRGLAWIAPSRVESPSTTFGVVGRMCLEGLLFRSLFRNTVPGRAGQGHELCPTPVFLERKALWLGALALHWSLLLIVIRHLRLFVDPIPRVVATLSAVDGFFDIGVPRWYATDAIIIAALGYLIARRLRDPLLRYVTLPADYVALGALSAVAVTGIVLRYVVRVDLVTIREWTLSLAAFRPGPLTVASAWLVLHLASVSFLLAILPFTKMVHAAGIWLSPTRNLANDSRRRLHVNPWNAPVAVHGYETWREEFRDKLVAAGLPIDEARPGTSGSA